ncbi:MAG: hypothetical protein JRF63_10285, partial [Deltaproteobacteria bacterium]|nr:hypothetical protein [Deltaproteobacteria bacterium]
MHLITVLELIVAALACAPAVRLLANGSTRRVAPGVFTALASMVVAFAGAMLYLAIRHPAWLHVPVLVTATGSLTAWWRARIHLGVARRLPPGSMSLTRSFEAIIDRRFYRDRFERHGPIFKMAQFHHRTICVLGLDLGHRLLRERADSLGPTELAFNRDIERGFLRYMDTPTHKKYGSLFRAAFSSAVVAAASSAIGAILRAEIEATLEQHPATDLSAEALRTFCQRLSFRAMLRLVFDLEPDTPLFESYEVAQSIFVRQASDRSLTNATIGALDQLREIVRHQCEILRERIQAGQSPSCSALEEILRLYPDQPDVTTIDNLIFVTKIASGNVGSYLTWQ